MDGFLLHLFGSDRMFSDLAHFVAILFVASSTERYRTLQIYLCTWTNFSGMCVEITLKESTHFFINDEYCLLMKYGQCNLRVVMRHNVLYFLFC